MSFSWKHLKIMFLH